MLWGGAGEDTLNGGAGNDTLHADRDDTVDGGTATGGTTDTTQTPVSCRRDERFLGSGLVEQRRSPTAETHAPVSNVENFIGSEDDDEVETEVAAIR